MNDEALAELVAKLGRIQDHDERSRGFAMYATINRATWIDRLNRVYDPTPNPDQEIGNCTGVAMCVMFNAAGNRNPIRHRPWAPTVTSGVLKMPDAVQAYMLNTRNDSFDGTYPPDDTGSSAIGAAKTAQGLRWGGEYRWLFGGADEVVQNVVEGRVVSVGTDWEYNMFNQDVSGRVRLGGGIAGGHQYAIRGYDRSRDLLLGRCWWGPFRDFWISRPDLDALLRRGGDAYWQVTT